VASADHAVAGQNATLSRFIGHRRFSIQKLVVKPGAFLPPPDLKTSAFISDGLAEDQIWWIADNVVAKESEKETIPARADILSVAVLEARLTIEPDTEVHPRHVNICGWPEEKEQRKAIDLELCAAAILRLR
jgi:hypothetical protein